MNLKIALAQILVEGNAYNAKVREGNMLRAKEAVQKASEEGADLVILPEDFLSGYAYGPINMPMDFDTELYPILKSWALEYSIAIASSVLDRFNFIKSHCHGFFIDKDGSLLGKQKRINVYESESRFVEGGNEMEVILTPYGKVGFLSGLDLLVPELARTLKSKDVKIVIAPVQAFSDEVIIDEKIIDYPKTYYLNAAEGRAMENMFFVAMVNSVGVHAHAKKKLFGESLIAAPCGVIDKMDGEAGVKVVEINDDYGKYTEDIPIVDINRLYEYSYKLKGDVA